MADYHSGIVGKIVQTLDVLRSWNECSEVLLQLSQVLAQRYQLGNQEKEVFKQKLNFVFKVKKEELPEDEITNSKIQHLFHPDP